MSIPVIPLRFINTPTVGELYEEEAKGLDLGVDEEKVNDLSDEYDQVSGNEAYYQLLFKYLPAPYRNLNSLTGTEGLFTWVKDAVLELVAQVKRFFKWIFSFFTSKQKITENKLATFEVNLDKHGLRGGAIPYPSGIEILWGKETPVPGNLNWMPDAVKHLKGSIKKGIAFADQLEHFAIKAMTLLAAKGSEEAFKNLVSSYRKEVAKVFTSGEHYEKPFYFEGGQDLLVSEKGAVKLRPNPKVAKKRPEVTFQTNLTQVRELQSEVKEVSNTDLADLIRGISKLEKNFLATLDKTITVSKELAQGDREAEVKRIVKIITDFTTDAMVALKGIETACYRSTTVALSTLNACINKS